MKLHSATRGRYSIAFPQRSICRGVAVTFAAATLVFGFALPSRAAGPKPALSAKASQIHFQKFTLDQQFRSEGVAVGDFNHDGKLDVAAGNVYYAAPDWKMALLGSKPRSFDPKSYSDSFANYAADLNGDGWTDLIVVDFPGKQTWWLENPREAGGVWKRHVITPVTNNENPQLVDIDGHGPQALVAGVNRDVAHGDGPRRQMAILRPASDPLLPWKIQTISAQGAPGTQRFSHGLGIGDINGDGRQDIIVMEGWWEAPATGAKSTPPAKNATASKDALSAPADAVWKFHKAPLGELCAQMVVYDFDGDGRNDVASSSAHNYGLWWHQQTATGWKTHLIDRSFSQSHALCLADINGDGLPDLVTGKRWWAHWQNEPGVNEPAVLFWYELTRTKDGPVWVPHQIDNDSGVGTQFEVIDIDGDGRLDIAVANKKGAFVFLQRRS